MAKHVSTTSPRPTASVKRCAFEALDKIESALIDATATAEVLDNYTDYQGAADDYRSAVETVVRHLLADMAALRSAFDTAHGALVKGGASMTRVLPQSLRHQRSVHRCNQKDALRIQQGGVA